MIKHLEAISSQFLLNSGICPLVRSVQNSPATVNMYHQQASSNSGNLNMHDDNLLESTFSDDELNQTHGSCIMNPSHNGIFIYNPRRSGYRSDQSVDRYTDRGNAEGMLTTYSLICFITNSPGHLVTNYKSSINYLL